MARGQRKSIEDKIAEQQSIVDSLTIRLQKETEMLEALLSEQKLLRLEILDRMISEANLSPEDVSDILQEHINNQYSATA